MFVLVKDFIKIMEEIAPLHMCDSWDNCGLLLGDENQKVNKIFIALDATLSVIDEAIKCKADLLVTHHPLMLHGIKKINANTVEGQKIIKLIQNNISFYAAHTNLDKSYEGLNDYLSKKLGLLNIRRIYNNLNNENKGEVDYLRIGEAVESISLEQFANKVKNILNIDYIHVVGEKEMLIKKVGVITGSGMSEVDKAIKEGVDVLITGDIKYHNALYAKEMGIALIDATHFGTENIVVELLADKLRERFCNIKIITDINSRNPIQII